MTTIADLVLDRRLYIETMIRIPNKERKLVPFCLNSPQSHYWQRKTRRDVILKARQEGFSLLKLADELTEAMTVENTVCVIISHKDTATARLLARLQQMYDSITDLANQLKVDPDIIRPPMHHRSTTEKTFPSVNSTIYIETAKASTTVQGDTIHKFHGDEVAFWDDAGRIMAEVADAVPLSGEITLVSTPQGEGDLFHSLVMESMDGNSLYTLHFYPWFALPDYSLPSDSEYALVSDRHTPLNYTDGELRLIANHNLTENQIRWRRAKIAESILLGYDFAQNYPEDILTCFQTTGEMVFDKIILNDKAKQCYEAPYSHDGANVWYLPEPGHVYIVGGDPTRGITDDAAAVVWDLTTVKPIHAATLTGLLEPNIFAEKLISLAHYYNEALLVPEANIEGVAVIAALKGYMKVYNRRNIITGESSTQLGWLTTAASKHYMVSEMKALLPSIITHDIELVKELRGMRYVGMKIESKTSDDIAMAAMIGLAAREDSASQGRGYIGSYGKDWWPRSKRG